MVTMDDDWPAINRNLLKNRQIWDRFSRILAREGAPPQVLGNFYKLLGQLILFFG